MSSRSHCIFSIHVEFMDEENQNTMTSSKMVLVDLAGSERIPIVGDLGK